MQHLRRNKVFDYSFLAVGLLIQVVTFVLSPQLSTISLISGLLGVCSVVLTAQGNIWFFLFGFGQVITYTYLCYTQRFYAEIAINGYYFVTMIYGVYVWRKRLNGSTEERTMVSPRRLTWPMRIVIVVATIVGSLLVGWGLTRWTDDTLPYLDAFTTIPALVAQVLMILVYREHWWLWLAVDVFSVAMWLSAGDYCMTAQYAFWCANCLYGLHRWQTLTKQTTDA